MFSSPVVWLTMIITTALPLVLEVTYRAIRNDLWPTYSQIWKERIHKRRRERKATMKEHLVRKQSIANCESSLMSLSQQEKLPPGSPRPLLSQTDVIAQPEDEQKWAQVRSPKAARSASESRKLDFARRVRPRFLPSSKNSA